MDEFNAGAGTPTGFEEATEGFTPTERNRVSSLLSDAMNGKVSLLALIPGRPLLAGMGKRLPAGGPARPPLAGKGIR